MTAVVQGPIDWSFSSDENMHRSYKLQTLVRASSTSDGPLTVMEATGLPFFGSIWAIGNDYDPWAFCHPSASCEMVLRKQPNTWWIVTQNFSTKPMWRCMDTTIQNPLAEPQKVSGSFVKYRKHIEQDANGYYIRSSALEVIHGLEKDANRPTVIIESNYASLGLDIFSPMVNTLNDAPMWGLPERCIMLTNVNWSRNLFGTCTFYYTIRLEFEIDFEGFDRKDILDAGYKVALGKWDTSTPSAPEWLPAGADNTNPNNIIVFKDWRGQNYQTVTALDGEGNPNPNPTTNPVFIYSEAFPGPSGETTGVPVATMSNFFALNVPAYF